MGSLSLVYPALFPQWSTLIKRHSRTLADAWFNLAQDSLELMQGSAMVIATRTANMASASVHPTAANDREMRRMVDEKLKASTDSFANMGLTAAASCQSLWLGFALGGHAPTSTHLQRTATRILGAGMAPYQRVVRSNVKRLRK